jgi:hypothetical protein
MIINMHCRLSYPTNDSTCSSFLFVHSDHTNTLKPRPCSPSSYHDQKPLTPLPRHRRRRLEDPVITYASNYYVINPRQTSCSPSPTSPLPSFRRIRQQSADKNIYCDLFNLLERPPPVKQRKKYISNDPNSYRGHRPIAYKNIHAKMNNINERKRHYQQQQQQQQQPSHYKEKKHPKEKLSSIQQYDQLKDKSINNKCIYQRRLSSKGFFRRVVRNYFCVPVTINNGEFSN